MDEREKGMQKKILPAIAAVAAVAVIAFVLVLVSGRKNETYRSIKIIEMGGGVTIEREGVGVLAASSNMNLISGDAVKTEQDAYAVLQLDSDKYVMLAESGSMTIVAEGDETNSRTAIQLDAGSVLSEIQNPLSNGSSYDIVTPNATMSVRGTVFEVRKNDAGDGKDIEVLVYDGRVAVGLGDEEPALYAAGEYTRFTSDENPRYVIERAEITEENLNPQFMERLEQINAQSRELNLGTARLASAKTQEGAGDSTMPADAGALTASDQMQPSVQTESPAETPTPEGTHRPAGVSGPQTGGAISGITAPDASAGTPAVNAGDSEEPEQEDQDSPDESQSEDQTRPEDSENNGSVGNEGTPGPDGSVGNEGTPGPDGNVGNEGTPGPDGSVGNEGTPGPDGSGGNEGTPGPDGNVGNEGTPGPDGSVGNEGKPGPDGSVGNEGTPGPDGSEGNEENPGPDGNGEDEGTPGPDGSGGDEGTPGPGGSGEDEGTPGPDGSGSGSIQDKQNFWQKYTWEDYKQAISDGPAEGAVCTVIYYVPYMAQAEDGEGGRYSTLTAVPPAYTSVQIAPGEKLTAPDSPEVSAGEEGRSLTLAGWCLEDGTVWDFEQNTVEADMCLYPLWADGNGLCYVPVICRSEPWCYYCNSVEVGSFLKETSLSGSGNPAFRGWKDAFDGITWDLDTDTVRKVTSLKASWYHGAHNG